MPPHTHAQTYKIKFKKIQRQNKLLTLFLGSFRLNIKLLYLFLYLESVSRKKEKSSFSIFVATFAAFSSGTFKFESVSLKIKTIELFSNTRSKCHSTFYNNNILPSHKNIFKRMPDALSDLICRGFGSSSRGVHMRSSFFSFPLFYLLLLMCT